MAGKLKNAGHDRRGDSRTANVGETPTWLRQDGDGVLVFIHLQPGARRSESCGEHGERLKIAVAAPPLEGRANEALIDWLAEKLDVPRRRLSLVAGAHSRDKTVRVDAVDAGKILRLLADK